MQPGAIIPSLSTGPNCSLEQLVLETLQAELKLLVSCRLPGSVYFGWKKIMVIFRFMYVAILNIRFDDVPMPYLLMLLEVNY